MTPNEERAVKFLDALDEATIRAMDEPLTVQDRRMIEATMALLDSVAQQAREEEREACAEMVFPPPIAADWPVGSEPIQSECERLAAAIRARKP